MIGGSNMLKNTSGSKVTVNHSQAGFVQEAGPAVLEEPYRENGEREQQDEDEQVGAVLPVALLGLLL